MDYTTQNSWLRLRKALRYTRLYGPRRTWIKIRGQYHKKKIYSSLPPLSDPPPDGGHVGILGCGNFAFSNLAYYLRRDQGRVLRAAMDVDLNRAASLYETYGLAYYTDDARRVIEDPAIDLLFVASNHASHTDYAVAALEAGKHVHIEKPHVVNEEQLRRLCRAMSSSSGRVALGFNRPLSWLTRELRRHLDSQAGSSMYNWSVFGHAIAGDHWYAKPEEGGRIFGNLCHWTDFLYQLVPRAERYPIRIIPTRWDQPDCDIAVSFVFGDGSIAAITFSSKGHAFEGVRESFSAQRGDVMLWLEDFHRLTVERVEHRRRYRGLYRDQGHRERVRRSYALSRDEPGAAVDYVWETGELFIRADQALRQNQPITVQSFDPALLQCEPAANAAERVSRRSGS